jgi:hypothetical protein
MFSVAPASVMLIGVLGLFVIMFATTRMALLERKTRSFPLTAPSGRRYVKSSV